MKNGPLVPKWASVPVPEGAIAVTPWDETNDRACGAATLVTRRQFTASGATFSHSEPMPCRFVAVSFRIATTDGFTLRTILMRLLWCRFTGRDGYRSGGQVVRTLDGFDDAGVRELLER